MFRKSGNLARAEQIVSWLNTSTMPKVNEIRHSERKKQEKIEQKKEQKKVEKKASPIQPKVFEQKRVALHPDTNPEEIFVNKDKPAFTGSGVILNNGKWVLTNRHVIEGTNYIVVRNGLGKVREIESVELPNDKDIDLALLILKKPFPSNYSLSIEDIKTPKTGEQIYVMGYPMSSILGRYNPSISQGIISKTSGFGEMAGEFQITAKMNKGNSGGPIINENGDLVAIAVSGLAKDQTEGINFGIKSSAAERFLKSNNINIDKSSYSRLKNKDQLLNILEEGTVYTYCN